MTNFTFWVKYIYTSKIEVIASKMEVFIKNKVLLLLMRPENKIYRAFFDSKKDKLYFNELKELSGLSDSTLSRILKNLVNENLLYKDIRKSNTYYQIKDKKIFSLKYSEIVVQKHRELNRNVRIPIHNFLDSIKKSLFTVVLYGSASRGEEHKDSDIDILIVTDKNINYSKEIDNINAISNHHISLINCTVKQFIEGKDHLIYQAKNTGFPIKNEQNYFEVILNEL